MHSTTLIPLLGILATLTNAQFNANLYLTTNSPTEEKNKHSLSTPEFNAILSHKLNISNFENLPPSLYPSTQKAQLVLGNSHANIPPSTPSQQPKLLIALYGNDGQSVLPDEFLARSESFSIPNPPDVLSFDALIAVYIGRIVDSLRLPIDSIFGVKDFLLAYHNGMGLHLPTNIRDWAADWSASLPDWIHWIEAFPSHDHHSINPETLFGHKINQYGSLDAPARQFLEDLKTLDDFVHKSSWGPVSFLRLSGLQQVRQRHGESSVQYRSCTTAMKSALGDVLKEAGEREMETMVVGVPGQQQQGRLGKRTALSILAPFKTSELSFVPRELIHRRRSVFGSQAAGAIPIIPSSRKCFPSIAECQASTDACNRHGSCIEGLKTSGGKCVVCVCQKSTDSKSGQVSYWSGDSCQKLDISSGFVLLVGSAVAMLILFALAVRLLASVGAESLPQQLASIHGHSKKLD